MGILNGARGKVRLVWAEMTQRGTFTCGSTTTEGTVALRADRAARDIPPQTWTKAFVTNVVHVSNL